VIAEGVRNIVFSPFFMVKAMVMIAPEIEKPSLRWRTVSYTVSLYETVKDYRNSIIPWMKHMAFPQIESPPFKHSNHVEPDKLFEGFGPVIPHAYVDELRFCVGEFNRRGGVKGLSRLQVGNYEIAGPFHFPSPDAQRKNQDAYGEKNHENGFDSFGHENLLPNAVFST